MRVGLFPREGEVFPREGVRFVVQAAAVRTYIFAPARVQADVPFGQPLREFAVGHISGFGEPPAGTCGKILQKQRGIRVREHANGRNAERAQQTVGLDFAAEFGALKEFENAGFAAIRNARDGNAVLASDDRGRVTGNAQTGQLVLQGIQHPSPPFPPF